MFNFYAFLRRKWSEYSEASGQKGTVVDELAVKPTGLIMADFYNLQVLIQRRNDFSQSDTWTEDEADAFAAKFFQPRAEGEFAVTNARIYFDEKKDIEITTDTRFTANNGGQYRAVQPGFISKSSFSRSSERFALYYVDVPIIAVSKGSSFNVDANEISQINNQNFTYKSVGNPLPAISGVKHETNLDYIKRLQYTINDKSLMNKRSVFARLPEFFPSIRSIYVSGANDKYMLRDLVSGLDIQRSDQTANYLGKITGENSIKHKAFYGVYPPNVGSLHKDRWGPFSVRTIHPYPLTIEATNLDAQIDRPQRKISTSGQIVIEDGQTGDPGLHGFPLDQEYTQDLYKGLYFDDFKTVSEVFTEDLFNIDNENVGFNDVVAPNQDWVYGALGKRKGNMGELEDDVASSDVIKFNSNTITLSGGAKNFISTGKDIQKRIGVKVQGTVNLPIPDSGEDPILNSNFQIMVGGINSEIVDGYTGIGFGLRLTDIFDPQVAEVNPDNLTQNAIVYIAHSESLDDGQVFAGDSDFVGGGGSEHVSITDLGALAETNWRIEPGVDYDFEFILHDDLRVTLHLFKNTNQRDSDPQEKENEIHFSLQGTVLGAFSQQLFNEDSTHYGTTMKLTLETNSTDPEDSWTVTDLRAFDTQKSKAMSLCVIDVNKMEDPVIVRARASAQGSVDGLLSDGYSAYIWDKESQSVGTGDSELTRGAWILLDGISNPNGELDVVSSLLSQTIQNTDRYKVNSRFGENIFIMFVASGSSNMNSRFFGKLEDDIHSRLQIDYIEVKSFSSQFYHSNNKADIYVTTFENAENPDTLSITLSKDSGDSFFELNEAAGAQMPLAEVLSVTTGTEVGETTPLADNEYTVVREESLSEFSSEETVRIVLNESDADQITVEYSAYPEVSRIQSFFSGNEFGKIFGDILVKHKTPVYLSFSMQYSGGIDSDQMIDEVRAYADSNNTNVFSVSEMVRSLITDGFANAVQEPIEVTYERIGDDGQIETGTFTDKLEIKEIEFFRLLDVSVSPLT